MSETTAELTADLPALLSVSLNKDPNDLPNEVWRTHPTNGIQVSSLGRARNPETRNVVGSTKLRNSRAAHGVRPDYVRVSTTVSGSPVRAYVHVLVLETFVGPRPDEHDADHIDTDIFNNDLSNLRWRLAKENRSTN